MAGVVVPSAGVRDRFCVLDATLGSSDRVLVVRPVVVGAEGEGTVLGLGCKFM